MIDQATVDKILDTANIVEVISDFVTLRKRGVNYVGLCPFHDERTASFSVSPAKGICKCFSCGKGGSAVYFIMEHEQLTYSEALKYLARKYNIEVKERELSDEERQAQGDRESMLILNSHAQEYFSKILFEHAEGRSVGLAYFHERGFRDDIIQKFKLGYSLDERDALAREAVAAGYKKEYLFKTGLCLEGQNNYISDRFKGRVMFPVFGLSGKVLAFGGRILKKDDKTAKYVNSPESEIYHKSNELYGIYQAKQSMVKNDKCYLVEGYTDVLSMHQSGVENVVASSGTSLTPGQIKLIHRFTNNITVIYDGDAAGIKASLRGIDLILKEGLNIKVVLLPDGDDPDSFAKKQNAESFTRYIDQHETDFIRFKTNLLLESAGQDPIKRAALITNIVQTIAIIPDNIVRSVYIKECSRLMEIDEPVLIKEVNNIKLGQLESEQQVQYKKETAAATTGQAPSEAAAPVAETPAAEAIATTDNPFETFERALIRYTIRYGEEVLFQVTDEESGNEKTWQVAAYIQADLQNDEIAISHPLYRQILDEAVAKISTPGFKGLERYFVSHADQAVSQLAVDLISEKYHLSKIHTKFQKIEAEQDRLQHLVPRAIFELKDAIIKQQIRQLNDQIRKIADQQQKIDIMSEIVSLNRLKFALSKELGERIIVKY